MCWIKTLKGHSTEFTQKNRRMPTMANMYKERRKIFGDKALSCALNAATYRWLEGNLYQGIFYRINSAARLGKLKQRWWCNGYLNSLFLACFKLCTYIYLWNLGYVEKGIKFYRREESKKKGNDIKYIREKHDPLNHRCWHWHSRKS